MVCLLGKGGVGERGHASRSGYFSPQNGQKLANIEKNMERDNFMSAEMAKEFGLVDHVIDKRSAEDLTGGDKKPKA